MKDDPDAMEPGLPPDYHTHTYLCRHAAGEPVDYAYYADRHRIPALACTDHCPTDDGFGKEHRMRLDEFPLYREMVDKARAENRVPILFGLEADYYRGCERFLAPFLEQQQPDIVLGSVHFRDYWSDNPENRGLGGHPDGRKIWCEYFVLIGEMAETGLYDVATHLDLPKRFGTSISRAELNELAVPALEKLAAAGMALEINTSGGIHSIHEFYPAIDILTWAFEAGVGLTFGSDAHEPRRVGDGFADAIRMARMAGYTHSRWYERRAWREIPLMEA